MKRLCIFFIRLYQTKLSPLKPPCCRFTPSCSAYAIEALQLRGFFVGSALAIRRILRCNPFGGCGYDPVPAKHRFKRLDLIRKKMGDKTGVISVISEKKRRRKGLSLLPWERHSSEKWI